MRRTAPGATFGIMPTVRLKLTSIGRDRTTCLSVRRPVVVTPLVSGELVTPLSVRIIRTPFRFGGA